jgi:very-short-patch-repair endonuclease
MLATPKYRQQSSGRSARQIARGREFRKTVTESENDAWKLLRAFRKDGLIFRRQHPIGKCIVDFCCLSLGIIVEVDGSAHAQTDQRRHDAACGAWLQSRGYSVLRISIGMVLQAPSEFVQQVMKSLIKLEAKRSNPLAPGPSPPCGQGEINFIISKSKRDGENVFFQFEI